MPIAGPSTAVTSGFSKVGRVWMNLAPGETPSPHSALRKSPMSLPAQKTPPLPTISTAPISSSLFASRRAAVNVAYIAPVSAFFFSGRARVRHRTSPSRRFSICSAAKSAPYRLFEILQRAGAAVDRGGKSGRGRRNLFRKEARQADPAEFGRIALRSEARRRQTCFSEACAAAREGEQAKVRRCARKRILRIAARFGHELRRMLQGVDRLAEALRRRAKADDAACRDLALDGAHVGDFARNGVATAERQFALGEIDSLHAIRTFIDRRDAGIAKMLRRACLFDIAHAAMDLNAERGDLVADIG